MTNFNVDRFLTLQLCWLGLVLLGMLGFWLRRRMRQSEGHWYPGRRGWKKAQVFLDGVPVMFCVEANVTEGWVRVMRPARPHTLPRGLGDTEVKTLEGLMEPDPVAADGRPLIIRLRGEVTVIP